MQLANIAPIRLGVIAEDSAQSQTAQNTKKTFVKIADTTEAITDNSFIMPAF